MFDRIWPIVRKEFIQIKRDRRTLAMVLVMPLMMILLMGYAVNTDVTHIPSYAVDQSRGEASRRLIEALTLTNYFDVVGYPESAAALRMAIDRGDVKAGFVIPPTFDDDLLAGRVTQVQLIVDGSDPNVAQTAMFAASAIIQSRSAELLAERMNLLGAETLARSGAAIDVRTDVLYNPDMRSINFMIPGLIGLIIQFQATLLTAFAIVRERERGTLEQLIVTPIRAWELMAGKIMPYVMIAFFGVAEASVVGLLWFDVSFAGSFPLMMLLSVVFLLSALGIGLLISTVSTTQAQAMQMAMFTLMPSMMISGMIFPIENFPIVVRWASYLTPLTYFLRIMRGIALKGVGIDILLTDVVVLAVFGFVVFAISANRFSKRLA